MENLLGSQFAYDNEEQAAAGNATMMVSTGMQVAGNNSSQGAALGEESKDNIYYNTNNLN